MGRRNIVDSEELRYTESMVQLKDTTVFFELDKYAEAVDYARRKRSYVGIAKNKERDIIGYYISA